ncbi:hypothetical protein GCM10017643_24170 [Ancylobacter dichloromethanicus]|uniref:Uncharacterized protein n=1 Tax=Ancylobacter dichloromethanicus TaxID=518825 RepID=A0A9W6J7L6_9HYPH|nr:hypothetical protein GCM10017643_24170 [Ancylobacter dichloromethanicus]
MGQELIPKDIRERASLRMGAVRDLAVNTVKNGDCAPQQDFDAHRSLVRQPILSNSFPLVAKRRATIDSTVGSIISEMKSRAVIERSYTVDYVARRALVAICHGRRQVWTSENAV